jgi:hypothetical protein
LEPSCPSASSSSPPPPRCAACSPPRRREPTTSRAPSPSATRRSAATTASPATRSRPAPAAPLEGEGENFELLGNLPIGEASDLELHGNLAFVGSYTEGLVIADISDPRAPKRVGVFKCGGGSQYDVQLRPDGRIAALTTDSAGADCHENSQGTIILDVSNPAEPREIAFLEIRNPTARADTQGTIVGSHTHTFDWPYLYINQYQTSYHRVEVFSLEDPANPRKVGEHDFGPGQPAFHDSFIDHRPDGRTLLYAGSDSANDVLDVTDPTNPKPLQRVVDPEVTFSHQNEPSFDRDTALVTDEYLGGAAGPSCGKTAEGGPGALPGAGGNAGDPSDLGALHLYELDANGLMGKKLSTFNIPSQANNDPQNGCTIHVFWQAPDQDRLVTAWYGRGVRVVDFSDARNPRELGHYIPAGTNMWAAKPHNGYIVTGDLTRGLDILRYTGEGWPANAGAAEVQRARQQPGFRGEGRRARAPRADRPRAAGRRRRRPGPGYDDRHAGGRAAARDPGPARPQHARPRPWPRPADDRPAGHRPAREADRLRPLPRPRRAGRPPARPGRRRPRPLPLPRDDRQADRPPRRVPPDRVARRRGARARPPAGARHADARLAGLPRTARLSRGARRAGRPGPCTSRA